MIKYLAAALLMLATPLCSTAQDHPPEIDKSGKGAILCMWSIYVAIDQGIGLCGLEPRSSDADVQRAIARMETFILENTTQGITQQTLADYKQRSYEQTKAMLATQNKEAMCHDTAMFRDNIVDNITQSTEDSLSIPREPLWNPCI